MSDSIPLSVVVVARNEADRLRRCLDSVHALCRDGPPFEVVYVDSNSSDGSLDVALDYPVDVLRIPADDLCSPAAGRYVGAQYARGDAVLFVDGDMDLTTGWLDDALALLERDGVAGVTGYLDEAGERPSTHRVDALRGVALYDAATLDSVGGFDPHLRASEDTDVGFRLLAAGHGLRRLPVVVATHPSAGGVDEPARRWRSGYFHGVGQALRKAFDARSPSVLARHLRALRHTVLAFGWLAAGLLALGVDRRAALAWGVCSGVGAAATVARYGVRRPLSVLAAAALTGAGVVLGARERTPAPSDYPLERVEHVRGSPAA